MSTTAKIVISNYKGKNGKYNTESNNVRVYLRGVDLSQYPRFSPVFSKNTLRITLYRDPNATGLKTAMNLASAQMTNNGTLISPYMSFAQQKYMGAVYQDSTVDVPVTIVSNTPDVMVLEMVFAPTKRRPKPAPQTTQAKPAKVAISKSSSPSSKRPTIPASVIASLVANNAAKIREVEIDGVVFEVV